MRATKLLLAALAIGCGGDDGGAGDGDGDGEPLYAESFDADGAWPSPWVEIGGVATAEVSGLRARLVPQVSGYSLARMHLSGVSGTDVDVTFTVEFADLSTQGCGFYARQNGGYLRQTDPTGAGYAVFVEGFRARPGIGVWREIDGDEQQILVVDDPVAGMQSNEVYRVRFQVEQAGAETGLRARLWRASEAEPAAWSVEAVDATPSLQNLAGDFAADAWSSLTGSGQPADLFLDDLEIGALP